MEDDLWGWIEGVLKDRGEEEKRRWGLETYKVYVPRDGRGFWGQLQRQRWEHDWEEVGGKIM